MNREISTILDVEDPLPFAYTLEVSSPGLDRPLRDAADYRRFVGRLAKIVVREAVDNQKAFEGRLSRRRRRRRGDRGAERKDAPAADAADHAGPPRGGVLSETGRDDRPARPVRGSEGC